MSVTNTRGTAGARRRVIDDTDTIPANTMQHSTLPRPSPCDRPPLAVRTFPFDLHSLTRASCRLFPHSSVLVPSVLVANQDVKHSPLRRLVSHSHMVLRLGHWASPLCKVVDVACVQLRCYRSIYASSLLVILLYGKCWVQRACSVLQTSGEA